MKKFILFFIVFSSIFPLFGKINSALISERVTISENDICATATTLAIGYNCLEFDDTNGTMTGASDEGAATPSCRDAFLPQDNFDKWYTFTMPISGKVLFQMSRYIIDEAVVYSGTCGTLVEVSCIKKFIDPSILTLSANQTYYLRLNKASAPREEFEDFCLQLTELPPNDICSAATPVTIGVVCDGTFFNGDNRSATQETAIIDCDGSSDDFTIDTWYSFVAPSSGRVVIKTNLHLVDTPSPNFNVYSGTCTSLEKIYCGFGTGNLDSITLVNPGETYFIQAFSGRDRGPFCISVKEQISFDNLFYRVSIDTLGLSTIDYNQMEAPTAIELDGTGSCGQIAFARVEPVGVIKLKSVAPFCGSGDAISAASGSWSMSNYRLLGLTDGVIPVTFTFEFTGSMSFTPKNNIGNTQIAASFDFSYGFFNSNIETRDGASSTLSHVSPFNSEFFFNDIDANEGTIDIKPKINIGSQMYNVDSIIADFIIAYNALPTAERNSPSLILSANFLTAINQPTDITLWDTISQTTLETEATNFLAALEHLGFDDQLGYDANTVSPSHLNYEHFVNYNYQRDLTVLVDNSDFFSRPTIWFNGSVNAFNRANPNTIISDFSNTGRLIRIRVPRETIINLDATTNVLQISQQIAIPIEVLDCNDAKLVFSELPIDSGVFNSADSIIARSIIESEKEVVFKSAKVVVLETGFHAQTGSQFSVEIGEVPDCDVSQLTSEGIEAIRKTKLVAENVVLTKEIRLAVYPNPFRTTTTIDYSLPDSAPVTIKIIDLFGQEKATLVNNLVKESGKHRLIYNPNNLTNGMYFVIFKSGTAVKMKKIMLIK